ncbi:unnamed protein product, partial [Pylaiella littoralis]
QCAHCTQAEQGPAPTRVHRACKSSVVSGATMRENIQNHPSHKRVKVRRIVDHEMVAHCDPNVIHQPNISAE